MRKMILAMACLTLGACTVPYPPDIQQRQSYDSSCRSLGLFCESPAQKAQEAAQQEAANQQAIADARQQLFDHDPLVMAYKQEGCTNIRKDEKGITFIADCPSRPPSHSYGANFPIKPGWHRLKRDTILSLFGSNQQFEEAAGTPFALSDPYSGEPGAQPVPGSAWGVGHDPNLTDRGSWPFVNVKMDDIDPRSIHCTIRPVLLHAETRCTD